MVSTATAANLLDADAFNQLVLTNALRPWKNAGYVYAGLRGRNGWELYRTPGDLISAASLEWYTGTNPAANTEVDEIVPAGQRWLLEGAQLTLVCDANVANRQAWLYIYTMTGGTAMRAYAFGTLTASQTGQMQLYPGAVADTSGTLQALDLGQPIELPAGTRLLTATTNRQVGDDYAAPLLAIRRVMTA